MKIIEKDNRHPVTVAFAFAISEKMADAAKIEAWKSEMQDLVKEITQKFVSFFAKGSVQKGLNLVLGILSLPVADTTNGSYMPEAWAKCIIAHGPKGLAQLCLQMIKNMSLAARANSLVNLDKNTLRQKLEFYAKGEDYDDLKNWIGYKLYRNDLNSIKREGKAMGCIEWIARNMIHSSFAQLRARTDKEYHEATPNDAILSTILFRISSGYKNWESLGLRKKELIEAHKSFEKNPKLWIEKARKRFDDLCKRIPEELRGELKAAYDPGRWWFDIHLAEGPPKLPKGHWFEVRQIESLDYFLIDVGVDDMPM